jgi:RNA polymerase sigma-70 factor (ECF subfamily)
VTETGAGRLDVPFMEGGQAADVAASRSEFDAGAVRRVVDGSQAALAELYDRHAAAVYRAAFRLLGERQLAEDVVQETFLALWDRAETFDPGLGSLRAWLLTIGRNRAIDRLRVAGRRPLLVPLGAPLDETAEGEPRSGLRADPMAQDEASDPEEAAEREALRRTVRQALEALPPAERTALVMAYFEGFTQREIATRLAWPLGTVKTRTRRALGRLREALGALVDVAPERPMPVAGPGHGDGPR